MESLLSDFDSFSESSSSEDQDDIESLYGGHARSILSNLEESIKKIDDFLLFERGFVHGDKVGLVSDPLGQIGKVVGMDMIVNLEKIDGSKVQNVSSRNLQRICSIATGDYVICGAWLGKVEKIVDCIVSILFDNGTKSQLNTVGPEKIIALSPDIIGDPQYPFYPGQRVQVEFSSVSKSPSWLCSIRKGKREDGTVCNVDAGLVCVDWLGCAVSNGEKEPAPLCFQNSKNLSLLPYFPHANWQLGDWCVLPMEQVLPIAYAFDLVKEPKESEMITESRDLSPDFQKIAIIVKTKMTVDVQWQDGSKSLRLDSHLVFPINTVDGHDFFPDAFVLEMGTVGDSPVLGVQRWGTVRSMDSKERTAKVKWCISASNLLDPEEEQIEEIVSAYELVEHPDYSYCLGEAVFRADKNVVDFAGGSYVKNHAISKFCLGEEAELKAVENGEGQTDNLNNEFLSNIGIVVGFKHGHVEVQWASGATNEVAPYEICRIDKYEGALGTSVLSDENVHQSNERLPVKENHLLGQNVKDVSGLDYNDAKDSSSLSLSEVAIGVFTSITSSLLRFGITSLISSYRSSSKDVHILGEPPNQEALEHYHSNLGGQLPVIDDMPEKITVEQINVANKDILSSSDSMHPESFQQFDMISDCSDHYFVDRSGEGLQSPQVKRGWLKKVNQEWSILKRDLPDTIYVRVYEDKLNLIRASIVGSDGTPYHDGLFFFDIYLPPQYPNEPPILYYHSGGLRINPNLYETGKVCLSLLNTWTGSSSEVWNPESSTILQVLLSLQALVLNEKPYFNEAGYDTQIGKAEGERNSISYNENAFLVSCRSMLYILCKPPKHFEALVNEHFSRRCRHILLACKAYMQGAPIGYPYSSSSSSSSSSKNAEEENHEGSSTGFKIMLSKLFPRLIQAFSDQGFDCTNLSDQVP